MSGLADPLPTVTDSLTFASLVNSWSSRRVHPLPSCFTATARRSRSMSAMVAWSSISICLIALSSSAEAALRLTVSVKEICGAKSSLRRRDAKDRRLFQQVVRPQRAIGVADTPKTLCIAEVLPGDVVEALVAHDAVADHGLDIGNGALGLVSHDPSLCIACRRLGHLP